MPLSSDLKPFYFKHFNGQNNKAEENELPITTAVTAQNCRYEESVGTVTKREILCNYNSVTISTAAMQAIYRYYKSDGTSALIGVCGTGVYIGNDIAGTFTKIHTVTEGKHYSFQVYKDLLIGANGTDNIFVNDAGEANVCWELGSCQAWTGAALGSMTMGNISYQVTIDNDAYVCGAISNIVTITGCSYALKYIPLGPSGTVNRKIYRKDDTTSSQYKLVGTLSDNATTTFTDSSPTNSGATIPDVTDDMPKGDLLKVSREILFIAGDPNNPNRIYYSNPYLPHFIQATTNLDYMDVSPNDNDEIMGIPVYMGMLRCFKRNTIRNIYITTPMTASYAEDPLVFQGTPAKWSIQETPYGIVYLGYGHWYSFTGTGSQQIIDQFNTADILSTDYENVTSFYSQEVLNATYTDAEGGSQYHDRVMHYNILRKALGIDTINVNCFTALIGNDESGEVWYGSSQKGTVFTGPQAELVVAYRKKSQFASCTCSGVFVDGTQDDPWLEVGRTGVIDDFTNTIDQDTGTIDMLNNVGTVTFPAMQINAGTFVKIKANVSYHHASDAVYLYTRTGASKAACEAAAWSTALTPPESDIASTPDAWFQMKVNMTANSLDGSPRMFFSDGYVIEVKYTKGSGPAETAVEWIYEIGYRNFDEPGVDKIFKKFVANHSGSSGTYTVYWYTENSEGSFIIDLTSMPERWSTFFPSSAFGKKINFKFYKNDANSFKLREAEGFYTPEPLII